ncbi:hypothetical protein QOZ80_3AG0245650 [Eleusine coracana subsp. coracana]|nr:hypothetical protein QOZ80_3AG0245650 [Eleusine coracana subsp. coracana]
MAPPSPSSHSSSPSWVILSTLPRVAVLDNDVDVSLDPLEAPPRVSLLTLSPRVFPSHDPRTRLKLPYIHAADPSGLLLAISPRPDPPSPSPEPSESSDYEEGGRRRLPRLRLQLGVWAHPLGVIAAPTDNPGFMLAEFQHFLGCDLLVCYSSETGEWVEKFIDNPPLPDRNWDWEFVEVVSHDAKLWWVDAAVGLVACDPFADALETVFVPLPEKEDDEESSGYYSFERKSAPRRCVQVSNGKFGCVDMIRARQDQGGAPAVTMRTLADPDTAEWTLEYEVSFHEIWAGDIYKASGLPEEAPELAFIHPENPDVLYFFVKECLFGVDMRTRKVVEYQAHELAKGNVSPSSIMPFVLPPALTAALPVEVSDDDVKEDESGAPPS